MNIQQINQQQKSNPSKDPHPQDLQLNLFNAFQGQLEFAENDLKLIMPQQAHGDNVRSRHQAIEKKRRNEDTEKSVVLNYWQDQTLENQFRENQAVQQQGADINKQNSQAKDQARQQSVKNAADTKMINQEVSKERISQLKPFLLSSAVQESGGDKPRSEFSELLQNTQNGQSQNQSNQASKAAITDFALKPEQVQAMPQQGMSRMEKTLNQTRMEGEKLNDLKAAPIQAKSQKSSSTADFKLNNNQLTANAKNGKQGQVKAEAFSNQLQDAVRESQKIEGKAPAKQPAPPETHKQNVNDVVNNVKIMLSSGKDNIVLRLVPEHLGKLEIKLKKIGDSLSGEFKVENQEAKKALLSEFSNLQQNLQNQGIQMDQYAILVKGEENRSQAQNRTNDQQETSIDDNREQRPHLRSMVNANPAKGRQQSAEDSAVRIVV